MADDQDTREVLFPQWMGADKHGLTIEQKGQGEVFVKEVKEESSAAHTGKVHEGDQIVGATIYFDNMSSEETAELLRTLNRHKVGLKLQNKGGDKSPCRSPMGTLSWEGRGHLGSSSSDILLGGDDEDYKRIYTKKIKPRLKSEDLAEGVDVRTERHSSTSSDGCTVTTITRRITTYTVDMPGSTGQQIDHSSPEFRYQILQLEQSGGDSPQIRKPHSRLVGSGNGGVNLGDQALDDVHVTDSSVKQYGTESIRQAAEYDGSGRAITINLSDTGLSEIEGQRFIGHFGRTDASTIGKDASEHVNISVEKQVGNSYPLECRGKASDMIRGSESTSVKSFVLDKLQKGEMIGSAKQDIRGESKLPQVKEPNLDMKLVTVDYNNAQVNLNSQNLKDATPKEFAEPQDLRNSASNFAGSNLKADNKPSIELTSSDVKSCEPSGTNAKTEIKTKQSWSNVGIDIKIPTSEIKSTCVEGSKGGLKEQTFQMSSFEIKTSNFEGTDDVKHSKGICKDTGLKDYGQTLNIEEQNGKIKAPDFNTTFITGQYVTVKGEKLKHDSDLLGHNVEGPEIEEIKRAKFETHPIYGPIVSLPDVGFNMEGPKLKTNVGVSIPKLEGPIKVPKANINTAKLEALEEGFKMASFGLKGPKLEGTEGKLNEPKVKMPSISGSKVSMADVDLNLKGPKLKSNVSIPKLEGDLKAPKIDIEDPGLEGSEGDFKIPKIKIPLFGIKDPKFEGSEIDVKIPKSNVDVHLADGNIKTPDLEIEVPEGKIKGPNVNLPSISGPKISMPDVDFNLKDPKLKGDVDVSIPKLEGDFKAPKVDIEGPELEGPEGGFKMPKIKMPSFGLKGPKLEGPDVDVKVPKANIDVKAPDMTIETPDLEIEGPEGKIKEPKFNMPSISGPKISMPDVDFNLKSPKLKGEVDVSIPKLEGDIKAPKVDIEGPELEAPEGGFKMPKIKMPSFGLKGSKLEAPDVDVKIPKANIDVKAPDMSIETPDLEIDTDSKVSLKGPQFEVDVSDLSLKGPVVKGKKGKFKLTKGKGKSKPFDGDLKTEVVHVEAGEPDLHSSTTKVKKPLFGKLHFPDVEFDIKSPKVKVNSTGSGAIKSSLSDLSSVNPKSNIESPGASLNSPDLKSKRGKIKMPKFGISATKQKTTDLSFNDSTTDVPGNKLTSPNVSVQEVGINGKSSGKIDMDKKMGEVQVTVPSVSLHGESLKVDFNLTEGMGVKGSTETGFKEVQKKETESGFDLKSDASISVNSEYQEGNVAFRKIKVPKFGIALPRVDGTELKVRASSDDLATGSQCLEIQNSDVKGSGGKVKVKMPKLFAKSKPKGGSAADLTVEGEDAEVSIRDGGKVSKELSLSSGELTSSNVTVEGSSGFKILPKSKSASLDLFKKSAHSSTTLSQEGGIASPVSTEGHLFAEGGNISLDVGETKVKGKKGKFKFATIGGFSSKSKGSYEVTEESEVMVESSAAVVSPSKKSRMSSSSSSDSGSKGSFRFPQLELSVSPKK